MGISEHDITNLKSDFEYHISRYKSKISHLQSKIDAVKMLEGDLDPHLSKSLLKIYTSQEENFRELLKGAEETSQHLKEIFDETAK